MDVCENSETCEDALHVSLARVEPWPVGQQGERANHWTFGACPCDYRYRTVGRIFVLHVSLSVLRAITPEQLTFKYPPSLCPPICNLSPLRVIPYSYALYYIIPGVALSLGITYSSKFFKNNFSIHRHSSIFVILISLHSPFSAPLTLISVLLFSFLIFVELQHNFFPN